MRRGQWAAGGGDVAEWQYPHSAMSLRCLRGGGEIRQCPWRAGALAKVEGCGLVAVRAIAAPNFFCGRCEKKTLWKFPKSVDSLRRLCRMLEANV